MMLLIIDRNTVVGKLFYTAVATKESVKSILCQMGSLDAPVKPYVDALVLSLFGEPTPAERRVSWQDKLKRDELDSEL
ncbi:hypothetical protein KSP40_PGU005591 [Platanthera guangdongensis]|uniref:Uncharacterized protein n=1 Tax=Platanthera guangdongensis TaxID=2320717 RepID=A0ABR2MC22_9ASPA